MSIINITAVSLAPSGELSVVKFDYDTSILLGYFVPTYNGRLLRTSLGPLPFQLSNGKKCEYKMYFNRNEDVDECKLPLNKQASLYLCHSSCVDECHCRPYRSVCVWPPLRGDVLFVKYNGGIVVPADSNEVREVINIKLTPN